MSEHLPYYEPRMISYSKPVFIWLMDNLPTIFDYRWPLDYAPDNYMTPEPERGGTQHSDKANFVTPAECSAEIILRLTQCRTRNYSDGTMVMMRYGKRVAIKSLSELMRLSENQVEWRMNRAIDYCASGTCAHFRVCDKCLKFENCDGRKRGRRPLSYVEWIKYR